MKGQGEASDPRSTFTSISAGRDVARAVCRARAERLGGAPLVELIRRDSHSCYLGDRSHDHDWGFGCGTCPACELRAAGWRRYRAG